MVLDPGAAGDQGLKLRRPTRETGRKHSRRRLEPLKVHAGIQDQ
jgi:hypothetical protein